MGFTAPGGPQEIAQKEMVMNWVSFETEGGGLLKVQVRHVVAIYDELGTVKVSTTAGGVHTLAGGVSVQAAAGLVEAAGQD